MKIICLSASNNLPNRAASVSTRVCELIAANLHRRGHVSEVDVVPLLDYDLRSCTMCGECYQKDCCTRDQAFNRLYAHLKSADGIFMVVPHYALIPSKVAILFEKFQEISFLHGTHDSDFRFPLNGKPIGLVVHGGQTIQAFDYYRSSLLQPLAGLAESVGMNVVQVDGKTPGAVFGISAISYPPQSLFCHIEHDWQEIQDQIDPLVTSFDQILSQ